MSLYLNNEQALEIAEDRCMGFEFISDIEEFRDELNEEIKRDAIDHVNKILRSPIFGLSNPRSVAKLIVENTNEEDFCSQEEIISIKPFPKPSISFWFKGEWHVSWAVDTWEFRHEYTDYKFKDESLIDGLAHAEDIEEGLM